MGMMSKMRSLAPWFILGVGGLFVLFMVLSDSSLQKMVHRRDTNVGSINGEKIEYQEFSNLVEQYRKNQLKQTGRDVEPEQMDAFRDQVWDALVSQKLIQQKIKEYGITVSDDEVVQAIKGPNPPQFLKQNFIDSTGNFNRAAYDAAIYNPQNKQAMIEAENLVRQQLLQKKLQDLLFGSILVSEGEIKRTFIDRNTKMSAEWASFLFNTIPDSLISVNDDDLRNYYDNHMEDFKLKERRKLKYVLFKKAPSSDDSITIKKDLESVVKKLKGDTSTFKTYVKIYSDEPFSVDTVTLNILPENAADLIYNAKPGSIIGPVLTNAGYIVYKLDKKLRGKETVMKASHILIKVTKTNEKEAKQKAWEIYNEIKKGANFEEIAKQKSEDGSAKRGGDLGWFTKGQMVPTFEKAVFSSGVGKILPPVKTRFGYHIIKVTGRSNYKYVIEKIVNKIVPSATTMDKLYNDAGDFSYLANKNDFESEAKLVKYKILETPPFAKDAPSIPGLGSNKALIKFAFENSVGDVSQVFKLPTGYVVAMVAEELPAGYSPFEKVKKAIENIVKKEKKIDKTVEIAAGVKSKIGNDVNKAPAFYPKAKLGKAESFTVNSIIPGIGRDYAFTEYALTGEIGKVSDPVRSNFGSYLIKVKSRTKFDSTLYSLQKNAIRDNLIQQKKSRYFAEWLKAIKEKADIVDNRYLFYR